MGPWLFFAVAWLRLRKSNVIFLLGFFVIGIYQSGKSIPPTGTDTKSVQVWMDFPY